MGSLGFGLGLGYPCPHPTPNCRLATMPCCMTMKSIGSTAVPRHDDRPLVLLHLRRV